VTVGAPPNTATCPICLGFPGTLPVLNRHAVTLALRLAIAAGAKIDRESQFARKNYFYPDLPKGYQISQYDRPFSTGGSIAIDTPRGEKRIRLVRIHLEEDAGKSLHDTPYDDVPPDVSLVDWNRAGVPLVEIVSEPDLRTAEEAASYLTELRRLLRYTGVSDGDMEKGNLRCDANVSVRMSDAAPLSTRVEIKNLNSIRFVAKAIEHEIERQADKVARGAKIVQETRLWDEKAGRTVPMRSKEEAHDYRYFPEPDLGLLVVDDAWLSEASDQMPELPRARRARFTAALGLPAQDAETLVAARELADYFERAVEAGAPARLAANWVTGEVLRWMRDRKISTEEALSFPVSPARLAGLLRLVDSGAVSAASAKEVLAAMVDSPEEAAAIVAAKGLQSINVDEIMAAVRGVVEDSQSQLALYRSGKTQIFGWFFGQVMKSTGGRADPAVVKEKLTTELNKPEE
jgi:aspartyl-tRNA(Asn)/glutamyl-tRNA(Gln) amidotransferase subunit B